MSPSDVRRGGFTLVEVLVVAVVVAVLATVALPNLQKAIYRADAAHVMADMHNVRLAVMQYREDTGQLPRSRPWGTTPPELAPYLGGKAFTYKDLDYRLVVNAGRGRVEFRARYPRNHPIGEALKQYRTPGTESGSVNWTARQTQWRLLEDNK